jgi:hypothetical protein
VFRSVAIIVYIQEISFINIENLGVSTVRYQNSFTKYSYFCVNLVCKYLSIGRDIMLICLLQLISSLVVRIEGVLRSESWSSDCKF